MTWPCILLHMIYDPIYLFAISSYRLCLDPYLIANIYGERKIDDHRTFSISDSACFWTPNEREYIADTSERLVNKQNGQQTKGPCFRKPLSKNINGDLGAGCPNSTNVKHRSPKVGDHSFTITLVALEQRPGIKTSELNASTACWLSANVGHDKQATADARWLLRSLMSEVNLLQALRILDFIVPPPRGH